MKLKKKIFSSSEVIKVWFRSFIVLMIFTIVCIFFGYKNVEIQLNRQIKQMSKVSMEERINYLDNYINGILGGLINITKLNDVKAILSSDSGNESEKRYYLSALRRNMEAVEIPDTNLNDRFIYLPESDEIFVNGTLRNTEEYFKIMGLKGSYEYWHKKVIDDVESGMICYDENNEKVYFRTKYTDAKGNELIAFIVTDRNRLLNGFGDTENIDIALVDVNNKQLLSGSGRDYSYLLNNIDFKTEISVEVLKDCVISYKRCIGTDWNYLCIWDSSEYIKAYRLSRYAMLLCIILVMCLGILMSYYYSKKNNRAIFKLFGLLNMKKDGGYDDVYKSVNDILAEARQRERVITLNERESQEKLLKILLSAKKLPESIEKDLTESGIVFDEKYFCAAEIVPEQYSNIFFEQTPDINEALQLAVYIISNVYHDLFRKIRTYSVEMESDRVVLIINCKKDEKVMVKHILEEGIDVIKEKFNIKNSVTISSMTDSINNISKCYDEISWVKEYRLIDFDVILDYDEYVADKAGDRYYYYSSNDESILIANIKQGDSQKVISTINNIFKINEKQKTQLEFMKIVAVNILDILIRSVKPSEISDRNILNSINGAYESIYEMQSLSLIKEKLCVLTECICNYIKNNEKNSKNSIMDEIKKYVGENYANRELSVNYIADKFNLGASFLSTYFKKNEGVGLLEYITRVRINAAKLMLKNTDAIMLDVAEKSGFQSERTFFRLFEKYVGMSPGKYRKGK